MLKNTVKDCSFRVTLSGRCDRQTVGGEKVILMAQRECKPMISIWKVLFDKGTRFTQGKSGKVVDTAGHQRQGRRQVGLLC